METKELRPTQQLVVDAFKKHCVTQGDFTLASGRKSKWYCVGRDLTFRGDSIELVGHAIMDALEAKEKETGNKLTDFDCVGGIVVGAIPVAMAVASITGKNSFAVRKEAKGHGDGALIAGPLKPGQKVLIVEDTVTTGGSLIPSIEAVEAFGCTVVAVAALLDRGGVISDICAQRGLTFVTSITAPDLGFELGS
jgi:orotate phosphoribosyltransferase